MRYLELYLPPTALIFPFPKFGSTSISVNPDCELSFFIFANDGVPTNLILL